MNAAESPLLQRYFWTFAIGMVAVTILGVVFVTWFSLSRRDVAFPPATGPCPDRWMRTETGACSAQDASNLGSLTLAQATDITFPASFTARRDLVRKYKLAWDGISNNDRANNVKWTV